MPFSAERKIKMKKIDWKRKLTSRKFWVAIIGFVTPTLFAFGVADQTVAQVSGIIMAGATLIAYILGEGFIDVSRNDNANNIDESGDQDNG